MGFCLPLPFWLSPWPRSHCLPTHWPCSSSTRPSNMKLLQASVTSSSFPPHCIDFPWQSYPPTGFSSTPVYVIQTSSADLRLTFNILACLKITIKLTYPKLNTSSTCAQDSQWHQHPFHCPSQTSGHQSWLFSLTHILEFNTEVCPFGLLNISWVHFSPDISTDSLLIQTPQFLLCSAEVASQVFSPHILCPPSHFPLCGQSSILMWYQAPVTHISNTLVFFQSFDAPGTLLWQILPLLFPLLPSARPHLTIPLLILHTLARMSHTQDHFH